MSNYGSFSGNGEEYIIRDVNTPRPQMNYTWNKKFLSAVNHFGGGIGAYGGRTATYIDPEGKGRCNIIRDGNRYFYIKEEDTVWNPGWYPVKTSLDTYQCTHGLGYTILESSLNGLCAKARVFVHTEQPVEIWTMTLKNMTDKDKDFKVYFVCDFLLEGYARYSDYNSYIYAKFEEDQNLLMCFNEAQERPHNWFHGFLSSDRQITGYESSKRSFLGTYGSFENPESIRKGVLSNTLAGCEQMTGVLEHTFHLKAGEEVSYHTLLGAADDMGTAKQITEEIFAQEVIEDTFQSLLLEKQKLIQDNYFVTPDEKINFLTNGWVKQQVRLCAEVGRDTGKGFRDQLQDAWAIAGFQPDLAREKIAETLRYQYCDGSCVRGWLPLDHHIYSDGPTWIAPAVNGYLKETGDFDFLQQKVPYLDSGEDTVWGHILTSARYSSEDLGEHGLVLAHDGDWNDSLNGIGTGGRGESVWTSISLCYALDNTAEIAREILQDAVVSEEMEARRLKIEKAINAYAWDGEWYLAAYNDLRNPVGSHKEEEGKIYLNSQTWAILSGVAKEERAEKCLEAVDKYLESEHGPLTLYPAYHSYNPNIGRLTGFVPGIWENGTPYCHGGAFKVVADCIMGRGDIAYQTLCKILPDSKWNPSQHSGCEPYALTNMYMGPENPRAGQTMFAWITGTAGWIYRTVTQYMLGFFPGYASIKLDPCIPREWKNISFKRTFRGDTYLIEIQNKDGQQKGIKSCVVDGKPVNGNEIPIYGDGGEHLIFIEM